MISHDVHVTQEKGRRAAGLALLKPVAEVAPLAAAILLALVALGAYRYGSVPAALAAARGRGLAVDAATKSVGLVEEGEQVTTDFTLTNVIRRGRFVSSARRPRAPARSRAGRSPSRSRRGRAGRSRSSSSRRPPRRNSSGASGSIPTSRARTSWS